MSIFEKLIKVQSELNAPKKKFNKFGNYSYRSAEDILEAVKPLLKENQLAITVNDNIELIGERYYIKVTVTLFDVETSDKIESSAYAREEDSKKGMDACQLTGSTSSYARKYALNGMFAIDDTKDSDDTNTHGKEETKESKKLSEAQVKRLLAIANSVGYDLAKVKSTILKKYKKTNIEDLTKKEYDECCAGFEGLKKE